MRNLGISLVVVGIFACITLAAWVGRTQVTVAIPEVRCVVVP